MKEYVGMVLAAAVTGFAPSAMAAPYAAMLAPSSIGTPVNLLASPSTLCDAGVADPQAAKICEVRLAAERRAQEVTQAEGLISQADYRQPSALPMTLLVPVQYAPGSEFKCAPSVTAEECERLKNRIPGAPDTPVPPPPAVPPAPVPPVIPPTPVVPEAVKPPVATDPESIIRPPRTGDDELVRRPPPSGSQMPVIVPQPEPPVIP